MIMQLLLPQHFSVALPKTTNTYQNCQSNATQNTLFPSLKAPLAELISKRGAGFFLLFLVL